MNSFFSALKTAHSFSTTRESASNPLAGEFSLCFVFKFFNIQLSVKTAFHSQKKLLSFQFIHDLERVNEFLRLNSHVRFSSNKVEVAGCLHLSRKILKRDRNYYLYIINNCNQKIFLVQFGINKHSQTFQRLQIALALRARAIFCSLWKICSCLFIPNCTRNHLITYTNDLISRDLLKQRHIKNQERFIARRFGVIVTPLSRD